MQPLSDFYFDWLHMTGYRDGHAFRCAIIATTCRLRYAVDPDGARPAVFLHDAVDGDGVSVVRRIFLSEGFELSALFRGEKQPPQLFCICDC